MRIKSMKSVQEDVHALSRQYYGRWHEAMRITTGGDDYTRLEGYRDGAQSTLWVYGSLNTKFHGIPQINSQLQIVAPLSILVTIFSDSTSMVAATPPGKEYWAVG